MAGRAGDRRPARLRRRPAERPRARRRPGDGGTPRGAARCRGRVRRPGAGRRGLHGAGAPRPLLRRRRPRRAPPVQLRADPAAVGGRGGSRARSPRTRRRCRPPRGPTGCSATTTSTGSRAGSAPAQARVAAMLLLTLRGTPTLYYGDELGLPDAHVPPERIVDVAGRDPERSPMPWTRGGPHAGFSTAEPWLPMVDDAGAWSVEAQRDGPGLDARRSTGGCSRSAARSRRSMPAAGRPSRRPRAWSRSTGRHGGLAVPGRAQPRGRAGGRRGGRHLDVALSTHLDRDASLGPAMRRRGVVLRADVRVGGRRATLRAMDSGARQG